MDRVSAAADIMASFAKRTGVTSSAAPRRYLWTDAFAICNHLSLERHTQSPQWREHARALIQQVHHVLGRHRSDDPRTGWISGLSESEGERHPTAGGLRIGKPLPERSPGDLFDERLEWERDGQYYHYLTRWMHALERCAAAWADAQLLAWSVELAQRAHAAFAHNEHGEKRLYWKMSIDLSRPLVASMGHHDALDGLVETATLQQSLPAGLLNLHRELDDLVRMCDGAPWETTDPLGLGLLLTDVLFLVRLSDMPAVTETLRNRVQRDAARSIQQMTSVLRFDGPASHRLPFRELGLSLGLAAAQRLGDYKLRADALRDEIESFWLNSSNQRADTWNDHEDINAVMLATSLLPDGYLGTSMLNLS
jgi:hypothetical protein